MRIVSMLPASTEIICALQGQAALVGRSHLCDYPPTVQKLPVVTYPKQHFQGIVPDVEAVVKDALSIFHVDPKKLQTLSPDVIITQTQGETFDVGPADIQEAVERWLGRSVELVALAPRSISDVMGDIKRLARLIGAPERGNQLVLNLQRRLVVIAQRAKMLKERPSVVLLEWVDPLIASGYWMPTLIEMAGGKNAVGQAGGPAVELDWDDLHALDPDVIVVSPCGLSLAEARYAAQEWAQHPPWQALRAVQNNQAYVTDGNQFFSRPGPRLVESVEILAEILHPDGFAYGHEGTAWARV